MSSRIVMQGRQCGKTAKRRAIEEKIHIAIAAYLSRALRDDECLWFHPANGGGRSKAEGGILKAMGVRPGVPDLLFIRPGGLTLAIEVKAPDGSLSKSQKDLFPKLEDLGVAVPVCRSVEDVQAMLEAWGVPLHARVQIGARR